MSKYSYGYRRDLQDKRDHKFQYALGVNEYSPIASVRQFCSPVEDQGPLGSCTANAFVGALEYLEARDGKSLVNLSRLFEYYNSRFIEGTVLSDSGATLRDTVKAAVTYGICPESEWKYDISKFTKRPRKSCFTHAAKHKVGSYSRISSLDDMLTCISTGYPFLLGFAVYESFESNEVSRTGDAPLPNPGEALLGGHAVLAVGYDMNRKVINFRNSWGVGWGDAGYGTLPFSYVTDPDLAGDMWAIQTAQGL